MTIKYSRVGIAPESSTSREFVVKLVPCLPSREPYASPWTFAAAQPGPAQPSSAKETKLRWFSVVNLPALLPMLQNQIFLKFPLFHYFKLLVKQGLQREEPNNQINKVLVKGVK